LAALHEHTRAVREHAYELGFDLCGFAAPDTIDPEDRAGAWVRAGYHADMDWFPNSLAMRRHIERFLPGTAAVIALAMNYHTAEPACPPDTARIARYARGRDYHRVLGGRMKKLAAFIELLAPETRCRWSVDSGPVLETAWAVRAGIGWRGKNSLVIHPDYGSWIVLGVMAATLPLVPDVPHPDRCGTCRRCIDACPAAAIVDAGIVDARRCISYHSIENRGAIPPAIAEKMPPRLFGCDTCQEVCPWNQNPADTAEPGFQPRPAAVCPDPRELAAISEEEFNRRFEGTAVRRAKHAGITRNARILLKKYAG
jgi:epoxyqueuosine reductase